MSSESGSRPGRGRGRGRTRRAALGLIGSALLGAAVDGGGAQTDDPAEYRVRHGDEVATVEPFRGDAPVEELYDYRLPSEYVAPWGDADATSGPHYQSVGTADEHREGTTVSFLYEGPNGASLVAVHGRAGGDGGAVTWRIRTLGGDADVEWLVKDDVYRRADSGERGTTNFDRWARDGSVRRVDWTWGASGTDGGVLGHLPERFAVVVDPRYGEDAALHGTHYQGTATEWQFLAGDPADPDRIGLPTDEPVAVTRDWTGTDPLADSFGTASGTGTEARATAGGETATTGETATETERAATEGTETESPETEATERSRPTTDGGDSSADPADPPATDGGDGSGGGGRPTRDGRSGSDGRDGEDGPNDGDGDREPAGDGDDDESERDDDTDDGGPGGAVEERREAVREKREAVRERREEIRERRAEIRERREEIRERRRERREERREEREEAETGDDDPEAGSGDEDGPEAEEGDEDGPEADDGDEGDRGDDGDRESDDPDRGPPDRGDGEGRGPPPWAGPEGDGGRGPPPWASDDE